MRAAGGIDDFLRAPFGRYVVGRSYLVWCHGPTFLGSAHWGRRDAADSRELTRLYALADALSDTGPIHAVVDGRALEAIDPTGFDRVHEQIQARIPSILRRAGRQAIVIEAGAAGARKVGMLPVLGPTDRYRAFTDLAAAFQWAEPEVGDAVCAEISDVLDAVRGVPPFLRAVRDWLERDVGAATPTACARELGLSERTLSRRLHEHGVTFRGERASAQLRAARALLAETDTKVDGVARRVGLASASQLGALFRRAGEPPPSAHRRR